MGRMVVSACLGCLMVGPSWALGFELDAFVRLSEQQRIRLVIAALQTRDAEMRNLDIAVFQNQWNADLDKKTSSLLSRRWREIRRLDDKTFLGGRSLKEDGTITSEFSASWDGKRARVYTQWHDSVPGAKQQGQILDTEIEMMHQLRFTKLLGIRMGSSLMTLPEWLEWVSKSAVEIKVSPGPDEGHWVKVEAGEPQFPTVKRAFWLDADKGFLPMRYRYDDGGNWEEHEVQKVEGVKGLYMPMSIHVRSGLVDTPNRETHMQFTVERVALGQVKEGDMNVEFPPGTEVVDMVARVAFRVMPTGYWEPIPLLDPRTGQVVYARERSLDEALSDSAGAIPGPSDLAPASQNSPATHAKALASSPNAPEGRAWVWTVLGTIGVSVFLIGSLLVCRRHKARKAGTG